MAETVGRCITVLHHQHICAKQTRSCHSMEAPFAAPPAGGRADEEIEVDHGIVDVFAYQEALGIEAIFGIVLLVMIWVGFRRWLQHKEKMGRLSAQQSAELAARYGAHME